ncbi:MAG: hypothetical protein CVT90_02085 [Candidatus Altiarchaeales archaeon HGW-Altiarchaeales-3]|nr:MAG: hypothetical protein CVT90_02085 [Candidatus Altiarchaeales archaeon HGW-Altiarchaeales-3]
MADLVRGVKAGAGAGAVMGLLGGILSIVLMFTILHDEYIKLFEQTLAAMPAGSGMSADSLLMISAVFGVIGGLIMGIIFGLILGLIYAALYDKIPGKTAIAKGLITGLAYFVIMTGFSVLTNALFSGQAEAMGIDQSSLMTGVNYITSFITALVFGYVLGWLWIKFEPKD